MMYVLVPSILFGFRLGTYEYLALTDGLGVIRVHIRTRVLVYDCHVKFLKYIQYLTR